MANDTPYLNRSQIQILFFLTSLFFINFTTRIIVSPLLPALSGDLSLSHDQGGSLFLISASGYFIALLCSGFVSSRIGHKKTIGFSAVIAGLAFISTGLSQGLFAMRTGLFLTGMATALYLPSGMALMTSSIDQKNWGKAIGIHELAPNLSFLLSPLLCEILLLWLPWRGVFFMVGGCSVILGFSFVRFSQTNDFLGEAPTLSAFIPLMKEPSFWFMVILFSVGVIGTLGVYSMLPLYLVEIHDIPRAQANSLITLSKVFTLPMPLLIGWISDKAGLKSTLCAVLFLTGITTILVGVLEGTWLKAIIFPQSLLAVCFFPPAFAALSRIGSEKIRNILVSFTIPVAFLFGGGIVPNLIGVLGDHGFFNLGFILFGAMICAGAAIPRFLKFHQDE